MRAFITGASGFIGGHLAVRLVRDGWQVRALVHEKKIFEPEGLESVSGDIRDFAVLKDALRGADVLFHLASALGASRIDKNEFFAVNAEGTRNVLRAAREAGASRIVHFSSAGVLGHVKNARAADENFALDPQDTYDRSKLQGEKIALESAKEGLNIIIVRPGWVYGPGDRRTFKLIRAIARRRFILIAKGKALQTPVYVDDLVDGALLCSEKGKTGQIYNLAGAEVLTVKQIAETIAAATGTKIPRLAFPLFSAKAAAWSLGKAFSIFGKEAPLNPSRLAFFIHPKPLSIRKAAEELGYTPAWDFKKGMAATMAWYRANGWL